jgi:hypothetical protein
VYRITKLKKGGQGPKKSCTATDESMKFPEVRVTFIITAVRTSQHTRIIFLDLSVCLSAGVSFTTWSIGKLTLASCGFWNTNALTSDNVRDETKKELLVGGFSLVLHKETVGGSPGASPATRALHEVVHSGGGNFAPIQVM